MFRTILVPIDGSDHAGKAVAIASDLATKYGARLVLLHVISGDKVPEELLRFAQSENLPKIKTVQHVERLEATPHGPVGMAVGAQEQVDRHAVMLEIAERLLDEAKGVAEQHGVDTIDVVTAEGDPAERILESSHREQADGIVMGSRGLSDIKGAIVGSVSHKVCHKADCTCITVT